MAKKTTTKKAANATNKVEMALTAAIPQMPAEDIDALLMGLEMPDVDETADVEAADDNVTELELESAVRDAEITEANQELYAEQPAGDDLKLDEVAVAPETGKTKAKKAKAPKEPKEPKERKVRETMIGKNLATIMRGKMGEHIGDFMVWDTSEATMSEADLATMLTERVESLNTLPMKPQNKFRYIMKTLQSGAVLQEYVKRAFVCLVRDGFITTGKEGNYVKEMTAPATGKPFGMGTATSQVAQMQTLLPFLMVATKEKGKLVLNPNSTIVDALKLHLGL